MVDKVMTVLLSDRGRGRRRRAGLGHRLHAVARVARRSSKANLYTQDMSEAGPLDPLDVGGIKHAIVGTLIIIVDRARCITVPLGLACAVFLNETREPARPASCARSSTR